MTTARSYHQSFLVVRVRPFQKQADLSNISAIMSKLNVSSLTEKIPPGIYKTP